MGLIYLFPTEDSKEELDGGRVEVNQNELILKTYGLPMIFWGYLAAILIVVSAMALVSKSILIKMLNYNDPSLTFLAYLVIALFTVGPIVLLSFYFYEKHLIKKLNNLTLVHKLFFIPIYVKKLNIENENSLIIEHFLDSPNMAKKQNRDDLRGFENKGYFELKVISNNKKITIDRSSRKADLVKIKDLINKY